MIDSLSIFINNMAESSLGDPLLAFPVYILAGFISSLFPCVYPLIPITAGFLQKRSEGARWTHPFIYWLGTIFSYTAMGMLAALGGGSFNTLMQNGIVITITGFMFLFLVFAMIDWHPVQFTGGNRIYQSARTKSGLSFTLLMGMGAGFIASACVAPALVTMLLFIAQNASQSGSVIASMLYGGFLSAGFGIGLGFLFFLAGIFGARLPRSGKWMDYFKYGFGAVILISAYFQIEKGLAVLGYKDMNFYIILLGILLIAAAVFTGLKPPEKSDRPALTRFLFALFALAFGFASIIKGINSADPELIRNTNNPDEVNAGQADSSVENKYKTLKDIAEAESSVPYEMKGGLKFYRDNNFARAVSGLTGKPLFIDFYADWCTNCKDFYKLLENNSDLRNALKESVLLKITDTDPVFVSDYADNPSYPELSVGLPFFVILNSDGTLRWKTTNYRDSEGMIKHLRRPSGL